MTKRRTGLLYQQQMAACHQFADRVAPRDAVVSVMRCAWQCSSSLKLLVGALAFCLWLSGPAFAQSYQVDAPNSQLLTTYLRQHGLPLVGAQVLANGERDRRIVLYGFVASKFGKNDAARKALAYLENRAPAGTAAPAVENRIEIRPEIARTKTPVSPSASDTTHESLDHVLNDIDRYGVTMAPTEPSPR